MKCPNCGGEINDNSNFCRFCGFNLRIIDASADKMFCHNCGNLIEIDSKFCNNCGVKVESVKKEKSIDDYLLEAKNEFELNNYENSNKLFLKALEIEENNKDALFGVIKSFFNLEEYGEVVLYSYKYIKLDANNIDVLNFKLESEININNFLSAKNTLNDLIDIVGSNVDLLFKKSLIFKNIGNSNELLEIYDEILSIDNKRDDVLYEKSKLLFDLTRYDESKKSIEDAIKINNLKEYEEFKILVEQKIIRYGNNSFSAALAYFNEGNYVLSNEILMNNSDVKSLRIRCKSLYMLSRNEEALKLIDILLNKNKSAFNLYFKSKIYFALNNIENAIFYCRKASELNKRYLADLAFLYGVSDNMYMAKKLYSFIDSELSKFWISYYENKDDLYISGIPFDLYNYPHACCLKINSYLKKSMIFLHEKNFKKALKFLDLTKKYFSKLKDCINYYKLDEKYIVSNFIYLSKLFENYFCLKDLNFANMNELILNGLCEILDELLNIYNEYDLKKLFSDENLFILYKLIGKLFFFNNSKELALKYFKNASELDNMDGELWLLIGNLSTENKVVFYNKALFSFEKALQTDNDSKFIKLKALSLYLLGMKNDSISIFKTAMPDIHDEQEIIGRINFLNNNFLG